MSIQRAVPERVAWRVGAAAAAALAVLTGCTAGSDEETTQGTPPDAEAPPATSAGGSTASTMPAATATTDDESSTDQAPESTAARATDLVFGETNTRRVSPVGESWIDPELLALADDPLIAWQEPSGAVRMASLDTDTGHLVDGSSRLIATDAADLRGTFNGPEFGLDSDGWSIAYTRVGTDGTEIAVARPSPGESGFDVEPISADRPRFSPLASQVPDGPTTRLVALAETTGWGDAFFLDLADPTTTHDVMSLDRRTDGDLRWVSGTYLLATNNHRAHPDTLALVNTETQAIEAVSPDGLDPTFPYGWAAPDAGSEVAALAVIDGTRIVAWAERDDAWGQWQTLTSPQASHPYLGSPEPFVVDGRSFVSFAVAPTADQVVGQTDQQIWLSSLDGATSVRCDDGRSAPTTRVDPEVLVIDSQVFVYYYVLDAGGSTVHVCSVDLAPVDTPDRDELDPAVELRSVAAESTDPALETVNGDHLTYAPSADAVGRLLVFFPGTGATPDRYETYLEHAGSLGLHVIGLGYDNLESVNFELCAGQPSVDGCHEAVRREILFGEASRYSPPDVTPGTSAIARLRLLVEFLADEDPHAGWQRFLDPDGADGLAWSEITVAGHSQGGGHAAYLATEYAVDRALLFGATEPQPWTNAASATAPTNFYGLAHRDERSATAISRSWANLGLPGDLAVIEDPAHTFGDSHRLQTDSQACSGDPDDRGFFHNCYIVDEYLPEPTEAGQHYGDAWTFMLLDPV